MGLECPRCGSRRTAPSTDDQLPGLHRAWVCDKCGFSFREGRDAPARQVVPR